MTAPSRPNQGLRRILLFLVGLGLCATAVDLLLIEHYEDAWQVPPLVLLTLGFAATVWVGVAPGRLPLRVFQACMGLLIVGGVIGLWLHFDGNLEFEREVSPELAGVALFWKAIKGASPPSLAPAGLIHLALLGLAFTYRHPTLDKPAPVSFSQGAES